MNRPLKALLSAAILLTVSGCTSQAVQHAANDKWCIYQDNNDYELEDELFPGQKREKPGNVEKCDFLTYEQFRDHSKEFDEAIAKHKKEHGL